MPYPYSHDPSSFPSHHRSTHVAVADAASQSSAAMPRLPGANYVGLGYDIIFGDPLASTVDPGYRRAVFSTSSYTKSILSPDGKFSSPDGFEILSFDSDTVETGGASTLITGETSLGSAMATDMNVGGGWGAGFAFKLSAGFKSVMSSMESTKDKIVTIYTRGLLTLYKLSVDDREAQLSPNFIASVEALPVFGGGSGRIKITYGGTEYCLSPTNAAATGSSTGVPVVFSSCQYTTPLSNLNWHRGSNNNLIHDATGLCLQANLNVKWAAGGLAVNADTCDDGSVTQSWNDHMSSNSHTLVNSLQEDGKYCFEINPFISEVYADVWSCTDITPFDDKRAFWDASKLTASGSGGEIKSLWHNEEFCLYADKDYADKKGRSVTIKPCSANGKSNGMWKLVDSEIIHVATGFCLQAWGSGDKSTLNQAGIYDCATARGFNDNRTKWQIVSSPSGSTIKSMYTSSTTQYCLEPNPNAAIFRPDLWTCTDIDGMVDGRAHVDITEVDAAYSKAPTDNQLKEAYANFINSFGSHYVDSVVLGARYGTVTLSTETEIDNFQSKGHTWQKGASASFKGFTLGFGRSGSDEETTANEYNAAVTSTSTFSIGSDPIESLLGNWDGWAKDIATNPMPVGGSLWPIYNLLTSVHFPHDAKIDEKHGHLLDALTAWCNALEESHPGVCNNYSSDTPVSFDSCPRSSDGVKCGGHGHCENGSSTCTCDANYSHDTSGLCTSYCRPPVTLSKPRYNGHVLDIHITHNDNRGGSDYPAASLKLVGDKWCQMLLGYKEMDPRGTEEDSTHYAGESDTIYTDGMC
jgi:hypothetical protein